MMDLKTALATKQSLLLQLSCVPPHTHTSAFPHHFALSHPCPSQLHPPAKHATPIFTFQPTNLSSYLVIPPGHLATLSPNLPSPSASFPFRSRVCHTGQEGRSRVDVGDL